MSRQICGALKRTTGVFNFSQYVSYSIETDMFRSERLPNVAAASRSEQGVINNQAGNQLWARRLGALILGVLKIISGKVPAGTKNRTALFTMANLLTMFQRGKVLKNTLNRLQCAISSRAISKMANL